MIRVPTVTVADVPERLPEGAYLLDVREPVEWAHGHIDGATHVPLMDLPRRLTELPEGRAVVICRVGSRSAQAVGFLLQQGYDAVNVEGGLDAWERAGRPMVSETGRPPQVV